MSRTNGFRFAMAQLKVGADKSKNIAYAIEAIKKAAQGGASLVCLPECFNCPYGTSYFPEYAENIPGPTTDELSRAAKEAGIWVIGGSIPERDGDKLFNTATVFDDSGSLVKSHRKVHLFDIDVPGGIKFKESDTLSAGDNLTIFETPFCKIGLAICYDIRFPVMAQMCAREGCHLMAYPGAFNMTTGPLHWELLLRSRAVDNQMFVAGVSPARDDSASYVAWGHSTLVDPMGEIITKAETGHSLLFGDIDLKRLNEVRNAIPVTSQKRNELYGQGGKWH